MEPWAEFTGDAWGFFPLHNFVSVTTLFAFAAPFPPLVGLHSHCPSTGFVQPPGFYSSRFTVIILETFFCVSGVFFWRCGIFGCVVWGFAPGGRPPNPHHSAAWMDTYSPGRLGGGEFLWEKTMRNTQSSSKILGLRQLTRPTNPSAPISFLAHPPLIDTIAVSRLPSI